MAFEMAFVIPGYFSWVLSCGTSLPTQQQCGTFYCSVKIKDVLFDQQPELKTCWNRVRDHVIRS